MFGTEDPHAELHGYFLEDLKVGMTSAYGKTMSEADILMFAGVSGDTNPVHLNHEYAAATPFKGRIAHGILVASLISTVLGTKLPGPGAIYINQNLTFKAPVRIGDTVTARVTITDIIPEKRRVTLMTQCLVGETVVVDGQCLVMVPSRNKKS